MPDIPSKCNGVPKPTTNPTPYGQWICQAGGWVWIPAIGKQAEEKK